MASTRRDPSEPHHSGPILRGGADPAPGRTRRTRLRRGLAGAALAAAAGAGLAGSARAQAIRSDHLDGLHFREIGPATMSGRIVDLAVVEPDPFVFYVATATGGVWKTTDNGVTFEPVFRDQAVHSVGDVAVHPVDTSVVWVGTGERASRQSSGWGNGVYLSEDGGESWRHVGLPESRHVGRIALHPRDPDVAFVAAMGHLWGPNEERGLYRTTDRGETWTRVLEVDDDTGVVDVTLDPSNPRVMYAASYQRRRRPWGFHGGGPGSALWKSTDLGTTWTRLTNAGLDNGLPSGEMGRIGISIHRADPRIVYVSVEQGERYNASTAYEQRGAGIYRSEDRGETWTFMSDWNPRPMYASQILVDPVDDQRVYMVNAYSFSDDGGRTFTVPDQSLHGDDRLVWVDPDDNRHVMKADDGGLGISWDRGLTWLYAAHLPISQWYRVSVDTRKPFRVYGGLQDNGSWAGPSATYRSEGILNSDWVKWGGGDGFENVVDTTNNRILYSESQYLGLNRIDMVTGEERFIRPGMPEGYISPRRNWTTWPDLSDPEQRLGNAMPPGNWDGPFIVSPHDPATLYAGLDRLYRSRDRGDSWEDLGDLTTGADRRNQRVMGELPDSSTLSLDDGIPYWPTLTAVAESPLREGLLYVGTDDGNVRVSEDGGATWTEVSDRMPGLPAGAWINDIEASDHVEGRVYVAANDYRNDDYGNYAFASDDGGRSWRSLTGGLPAERVVRVVHEDPRDADVLWMGTELGLFWSPDLGASWTELDANLPTVAVNDVVVHPRDNDLVVATHGRGIWILDDVSPLQELTAAAVGGGPRLFSMEPAEQIRYRSERGHVGDAVFRGENPPEGALVRFWLDAVPEAGAALSVHDGSGARVAEVPLGELRPGVNRAVWNLRHAMGTEEEARRGPSGPLVVPGRYAVRLTVGAAVDEKLVEVREDPRIDVPHPVRRAWTEALLEIAGNESAADARYEEVRALLRSVDQGERRLDGEREAKARDLARELGEVRSRLGRLRGSVEGWVGPLRADEAAQRRFLGEMLETLSAEWRALRDDATGGAR